MVDPLSVFGAVTGFMQVVLQLKAYFDERKARKQQQHVLPWRPDGYQQHQIMITTYSPVSPNYYQNHITNSLYYVDYPAPHNVAFDVLVPYTQPLPDPWLRQWPQLYINHPPPHYMISDSSARSTTLSDNNHHQRPYNWVWLGGRLDLVVPQEAPHILMNCHERRGMRTGGQTDPYYRIEHAHDHWKSFLQQGYCSQGAIAVVDWTRRNIDMFVESNGVYFRNYRIYSCNVVAFANLCEGKQVFSGEISNQKLTRMNNQIMAVDDFGRIRSTNSWISLGIYDDSISHAEYEEERVFMQMLRGAVFGLVCCLYESPCELNVNMESSNTYDVVHINTDKELSTLVKRDNCCFSVFSFNTQEWATQYVLVG